ncbi:hypothetical protein WHR41_07198 [Cladosporium halotolerans]|uniref:Transcription elongation factor n=1 Tax=Cladosporium halotolerans TaxID=1052096 RepID=A0AB34KIT2_9PEZI
MATMDAKTLHSTGKQITKAIESGDSAEGLLNLLQPLSKWTATEDLLRQSKIGVIVSKLRQQKDPKVVEQASKLVNKWKSDVNASKKKSSSSPAPSSAASKASAAANGRSSGTSSPAPAAAAVKKEKEQPKKSTADPAKRNSNVDGISTAVTGNQTRDSCVKLMYDGLAFMSEEAPEDLLKAARSVELAAYNTFQPETSATYKQKMRSLFQNLKIKNNDQLRSDVYTGAITPDKFVNMSGDDLKSAEKRAADAAIEKENMRVAMTATEQKAISTTMQCGKCKFMKVAYSQAQTRSADEPMTTFCECMNCGNRWKFS